MCYLPGYHSPDVLLALLPFTRCVTCLVTIHQICYLPCYHSPDVLLALLPFTRYVTCLVTVHQMCYLSCDRSPYVSVALLPFTGCVTHFQIYCKNCLLFSVIFAIKISFTCIELVPKFGIESFKHCTHISLNKFAVILIVLSTCFRRLPNV